MGGKVKGLPGHAFKKAERILRRAEFLALADVGKKIQNRHFIAISRAGSQNCSRLGITVTKRVGGAVTRNRIKRRVREFFRTHKGSLRGALDINIIAKRAAAGISPAQTAESLRNLFDRLPLQTG